MNKGKVTVLGRKQAASEPSGAITPIRATLDHVDDAGFLVAQTPAGVWTCEVLEMGGMNRVFVPGDRLLVLPPADGQPAVVLGRISRAQAADHIEPLCIQAQRQLTLKCGESSIDLRADGKVMIRGEDVLVRAKGTKRIRAGTVSIN